MTVAAFTILGFVLTLFGIRLFLNWSKRKNIVDLPNERSSHRTPTPIGGGVVIVLVSLGLFLAYYYLTAPTEIPWIFFFSAALIATVSWLDDLYKLPILIRFAAQIFAAAVFLYSLSIPEVFSIPLVGSIAPGSNFAFLIWLLWIVWLINAYNFMDGIDGIAGVQAVVAGTGWALYGFWQGNEQILILSSVIVAAGLGFLKYNWQPAKIFMGDVGSAFLGFIFAVLPLLAANSGNTDSRDNFLLGVLFVWFFVFDTVITLFTRLFKGEKVWNAHRSHMYQKLVIGGYEHSAVTLLYGALSVPVIGLAILGQTFESYYRLLSLAAVAALSIFLFVLANRKFNRSNET